MLIGYKSETPYVIAYQRVRRSTVVNAPLSKKQIQIFLDGGSPSERKLSFVSLLSKTERDESGRKSVVACYT